MNPRIPALLSLAFLLAAPTALPARTDAPAQVAIAPTADQATTSKLVYGLLSDSRYAYRPRPADAAMSADIFRRYLESLDGSRQFFTAADIERFASWRGRMADAVRNGDPAPAFAIFVAYRERVGQRAAHARALLEQDFDFSGHERWEYDRKDVPWAADEAALDEVWRKSVMNDWLRLKLAGKAPDEIRKTLDKRYAQLGRSVTELKSEDVFSLFLNAYTSAIDPHTDYLNPRTAENFNQAMSLSLEGIGAQLQRQDDVVVIREIIPGGPASLDGTLKAGDRIVGVGQGASGPVEDVVGWRIDDVVAKIRGAKDTQVNLEYIPAENGMDGEHRFVLLTRARVQLAEQAAKSKTYAIPAKDGLPRRVIGVIELPTFYQDFEGRRRNGSDYTSATRDVANLLDQFKKQGVDGVVLDLRNNGGGSLDEAVQLTGLFVDQGPVVQVRESGGRVSVNSDRNPGVAWDGPLAVLINRASASASEIFAGAMQDYGRALIIGETTFGKGTVQNLVDLDRWPTSEGPRFGQVKLTIAQFFRIEGGSTQHKGVVPDIAYPLSVDANEFGESTYDNALPWTRIAAVPHTRYGNFAPLLPRLQALHAQRIADDLEFRWWSEDVVRYREEAAKKYLSLNEAERRTERDRQEAQRKERQAIRKEKGLDLDPLADESDDGLTAGERDVVKDAAREKAAEKRPDPLQRESAAILADAIGLLQQDRPLSAQVLPKTASAVRWAE
ncbi:tail-specific protease [Pseudoxanthomonas broegbernensis]|uniref:Tail-specific protease n=1 Tax=Pseudoxanthomonas broegbernensis TaxID=83619 RepID=A0A7V8K6C0_9GAMM|nr:carboxy terminal-processing peptidase [Pseudoxanthomonas broegbernensis]KAF1684907.1 tail-specific protease [Pseudoxanthomonas broegbernensis]MBB6066277.1 carboxyl-terminal processing protease [Pseudoxanthomonas broegbernensis]